MKKFLTVLIVTGGIFIAPSLAQKKVRFGLSLNVMPYASLYTYAIPLGYSIDLHYKKHVFSAGLIDGEYRNNSERYVGFTRGCLGLNADYRRIPGQDKKIRPYFNLSISLMGIRETFNDTNSQYRKKIFYIPSSHAGWGLHVSITKKLYAESALLLGASYHLVTNHIDGDTSIYSRMPKSYLTPSAFLKAGLGYKF